MSAALRPETMDMSSPMEQSRHSIVERLSHELRTPLNSVIGFSRVLQGNRTGNQRPADLAMLEAIRSNGERLLGLVEDLVALSVYPPVVDLPVSPSVKVADVVEDVIDRWADAAEAKGLVVTLDADSCVEWRADPTNLMRLLDKLIGNAVKFTARGGVYISISGRNDAVGASSQIVVEDTGIGIPAAQLDSIFEPFSQVDGAKSRRYEGAGLGLPIARALARSMGCALTVESEQGMGTRFVVEFLG